MSSALEVCKSFELSEDRYVDLLGKLIGEVEFLQNNPAQGHTPEENRASNHVMALLEPYSVEKGGILEIERVEFTPGRGNLLVKVSASSTNPSVPTPTPEKPTPTLAFLGSHLDVVPANPETWDRNPFELSREGDRLYGRGTTDCLGHVALLTELLLHVATSKPVLIRDLYVIFIANEESTYNPGVGVDGLMNAGKLSALKNGPLFWIDSADSQPCIGTCGMSCWSLKVAGKLFHSGLPHRGINPIELGMLATQEIQKRFYEDFGKHPEEERYNFVVGSSLKPTQIECAKGSLNQIPPSCTISGDLRLVPFYDIHDCKSKIESYVKDMNEQMGRMSEKSPTPFANYIIEDGKEGQGKLTLDWIGEGENGIACTLGSEGNVAITEATKDVKGSVSPYSITGSLPLVRYLQDNDFDVQIAGYGLSSRYHADNEFAELDDFKQALKILSTVIGKLN